MGRLIDADKLIEDMKQECNGRCSLCVYYTFLSDDVHCGLVDTQPTVEAVPVVRGTWMHDGFYWISFKCSACGKLSEFKTPFCSNCGANMRGKQNE